MGGRLISLALSLLPIVPRITVKATVVGEGGRRKNAERF